MVTTSHADEEYIDMEVSSCSSNLFCYSPAQSREFEFQMCSSVSRDAESSTSPADELFYKGKLLPLHLPPRLLMVQKLIESPSSSTFEESCSLSVTPSKSNTPLEACSELKSYECFFELNGFIGDDSNKSWSGKLKQCSISRKLKASKAFLKSLFSKSGCSNESCCAKAENVSKSKDCVNRYIRMGKKKTFGEIDNGRVSSIGIDKEDAANSHRRSFSGAIQRHSAAKSSSTSSSGSSSSSSSSSFSFSSGDLHLLKRSNSANSEIETSIEGAIAHCKQSQQLSSWRKTDSQLGVCSLSASKIAVGGDQ